MSIVLIAAPLLLGRPNADHNFHRSPGQSSTVARTVVSPRKTFRLEFVEKDDDDGDTYSIWVATKGKRKQLPPQSIEEEGERSDHLPNPPECFISPDDRSIFCVLKVHTGLAIGYLYERRSDGEFKLSRTRFDKLAWSYCAKVHATTTTVLQANADGSIIDFLSWSKDGRKLKFFLKPVIVRRHGSWKVWTAVYNIPSHKFSRN